MAKWTYTRSVAHGGRFVVLIAKPGKNGRYANTLRGAPVQLDSYSNADPFGDSTAQLTFPQLSIFDDLQGSDLDQWLGDFANVDIWWVPATETKPSGWDEATDNKYAWEYAPFRDENEQIVYAPLRNYLVSGGTVSIDWTNQFRGTKVWEGFIASMEMRADSGGSSIQVQCQGALYQVDRYLEKPFFPGRPQTLESLIAGVFDHHQRPNLRTQPLKISWPTGWSKVGPPYPKNGANIFTPNITPGKKWSGYSSRSTGSWDHSLTSFVQDNLSVMLTQTDSGVTPGNQWTLLHRRQTNTTAGRQPILKVRDRYAAPLFEIWAGTPGIEMTLTRDTTQMANVIYGDGTGVDGTVWRNAVISSDGSRTDYLPLAADRSVYPPRDNDNYNQAHFVSEAYVKYGTGFDQTAALESAQRTLRRDLDAGWSGTVTMSVDPDEDTSRFTIQAGTSMRIKGVVGTGDTGMVFHIASVEVSPQEGTVSLTVDTRFRDLLNLEEAIARNRDPLTPAKLLQVNRASGAVEDIQGPWDYTAGSGFVPTASKDFERHKPNSIVFPYTSWTKSHPPTVHPHWYVKVNANAPKSKDRWTIVRVLMSEKGTISHSEFCAYDRVGNVVKVPFHVSVYQNYVTYRNMPMKDGVYSPFITGAFESINPATGQEWDAGNFLAPDPAMIVGWGNYRNKAGYSPGRMTDDDQPTGKLVDDSTWDFDCTNNKDFNRYAKPGKNGKYHQQASAISVWVAIYAEYTHDLFFRGRFFRQSQGAG